VARALERVAAGFDGTGLTVELADGAAQGRPRARGRPDDRAPVRELLSAGRRHGSGYGIPSFGDGGDEVVVPIGPDALPDPEPEIVSSSGDRIIREAFQQRLVMSSPGNHYYYAGGTPYVIAGNINRALSWGRLLFGGLGFALLQPTDAKMTGQFYAVPLTELLRSADLVSAGQRSIAVDGQAPMDVGQKRGELFSSDEFTTALVVTADNIWLSDLKPGAAWSPTALLRALNAVPQSQRGVSPADARSVAANLLGSEQAAGGDSRELDLIVNMDRTVFAAMSWETRARYLTMLVDAWTNAREEIAILELVHATRSVSELEAMFAIVRSRPGLYTQLFRDLNGRVFELLKLLGEYQPAGALDWRYLFDVMMSLSLIPGIGGSADDSPLEDIKRSLVGSLHWLESMATGVRDLLTHPDQVVEGLIHLAELVWLM
jgi:hypothetical protein